MDAFSVVDLTSPKTIFNSSLSLTSPHCWHMNPLLSADPELNMTKDANIMSLDYAPKNIRAGYTRITKQETIALSILASITFQN